MSEITLEKQEMEANNKSWSLSRSTGRRRRGASWLAKGPTEAADADIKKPYAPMVQRVSEQRGNSWPATWNGDQMNFKIEPEFEKYWPPLPDEKFIILEKSILDEGMRENLVVWKEKNILLDGHQRLRILQKHKIKFDDRVDYLSFSDEIHAKRWVHITQAGRRDDVPQFLSICHVMEFEPIYRDEAKGRQVRKPKDLSCAHGTGQTGLSRAFMARDSAASEHSIQRVLFIKAYDLKRFDELKARATGGEDISIHLEWSKVKAAKDAKKAGVKLDRENLEKFDSSNTVRAFSESVRKYKPPVEVQRSAADAVMKSKDTADKNFIEDQVIHRLPKKPPKEKEKSAFVQIKEMMSSIESHMCKAVAEIEKLQELRSEVGDDLYFRALAESPGLRAAFAQFVIAAKSFQNGGKK